MLTSNTSIRETFKVSWIFAPPILTSQILVRAFLNSTFLSVRADLLEPLALMVTNLSKGPLETFYKHMFSSAVPGTFKVTVISIEGSKHFTASEWNLVLTRASTAGEGKVGEEVKFVGTSLTWWDEDGRRITKNHDYGRVVESFDTSRDATVNFFLSMQYVPKAHLVTAIRHPLAVGRNCNSNRKSRVQLDILVLKHDINYASSSVILAPSPNSITATSAPSLPPLILIHLPNLGSFATAAITAKDFVGLDSLPFA